MVQKADAFYEKLRKGSTEKFLKRVTLKKAEDTEMSEMGTSLQITFYGGGRY